MTRTHSKWMRNDAAVDAKKPRETAKPPGDSQMDAVLDKTHVEDGIMIPNIMAWGSSSPAEAHARLDYLYEIADELSLPPEGLDHGGRRVPVTGAQETKGSGPESDYAR